MKKAIFAGTFDPMTLGHLDVIQRGAAQFDQLLVAVLSDPRISTKMSASLRLESVAVACSALRNVEVIALNGLLVDCAAAHDVAVVLRSLRSADDFQYEYRMSVMNQSLSKSLETVFLMSSPAVATISSSLVRQILCHDGDVSAFVPNEVLKFLDEVSWR